jgi:hypothetical protein
VPIDVQVIFVLGLLSRQNKSGFIHLAVAPEIPPSQHYFHGSLWFENHELFVAQGDHGIDVGGTAGGNVTCEQCHTTKKNCNTAKNERISASNSEE